MSFYIGQKVVCVDDKNQRFGGLELGCKYVVSELRPSTKGIKVEGLIYFHHDYRFVPDESDSIEYAEKLLEEITIEINEENLIEK